MMQVDLKILVVLQCIIFLAEFAVFLFQTRVYKNDLAVRFWMTGSLLLAVGMAFMTLVRIKALLPLAIIANPLFFGGVFLLLAGTRSFFGEPRRRVPLIALYGACVAIYYVFMFVVNDLDARAAIIHLSIALGALLTALTLLRHRHGKFANPAVFLARIFVGYLILSLLSVVHALVGSGDNTYASQKELLVIALIYPAFFSILWTYGFNSLLAVQRQDVSAESQALVPFASINLSKREIEIAELLLRGLAYDEIAEKSFISKNTVKTHAKSIYMKFDVENRVELMRRVAPREGDSTAATPADNNNTAH